MVLFLLAMACRTEPAAPPAQSTGDTSATQPGPEVVLAEVEVPDTPVHLVRRLRVETDVPTSLELRIDDGLVSRVVAFPGVATEHEVPVLGLPADHDIELTVFATDEEGRRAEQLLPTFRTEALPEGFPQLDVFAHVPEAMEPGYRMFNVRAGNDAVKWLLLVDRDLRLVWWRDGPPNFTEVRQTSDGTLVGLSDAVIVEEDMLGQETGRWAPPASLHHELFPRPGGGWYSLGYGATVTVDDFPLSYADPLGVRGEALIRPDTLLDIAADGTIERESSLADVLDTGRIGFGSLDFVGFGPTYDWSHANGLTPVDDGGFIVSLRHQGALVKLDADHELVWILSDPAGWGPTFGDLLLDPVGEISWPYAQHAPEWTDDGLLVVFDNHNDGHTPYTEGPAEQPPSRGIAYRVDEAARTVEVAWEIPSPGPLFSGALGDADVLPQTGNVLLDFGYIRAEDGVPNLARGRGQLSIRLVEAHPDRPDAPVLDLSVWADLQDAPRGYQSYRAEHLPSLYPDDVAVRTE